MENFGGGFHASNRDNGDKNVCARWDFPSSDGKERRWRNSSSTAAAVLINNGTSVNAGWMESEKCGKVDFLYRHERKVP